MSETELLAEEKIFFKEGDMVSFMALGEEERQYGLVKTVYLSEDRNFQTALARVLINDGSPVKVPFQQLRMEGQAKRNKET